MGGRRSLAALVAALVAVGAASVASGWPGTLPPISQEQEELAGMIAPPLNEGSVTSLHSPRTAQEIAAMLGARVRLVWLRARDWREVRRASGL